MKTLTIEQMVGIEGGGWREDLRAGLSAVSTFCRITIMTGWVTINLMMTVPGWNGVVGGFLTGCIAAMGLDIVLGS